MKVNIYQTEHVTDEQRRQIAALVDVEQGLDVAAQKRLAERQEVKDYVWGHGSKWAEDLASEWATLGIDDTPAAEQTSEVDTPAAEAEDDLVA